MDALQLTGESAWALWQKVRSEAPLIQCITNFVSMDFMANTLLAAGASPAMAHCRDEVQDFQKIASALLVNVGTLSPEWTDGMRLAAEAAIALGKPWVLDPVGAGATPFRTQTIVSLVNLRPTVIRGNASEIMAVAGAAGKTKGVDSTAEPSHALEYAKQLAKDLGCIVAISGATDLVTDGERVAKVSNGVPLLTKITAAGCSVTALITAFVCCAPSDPLLATAHALAVFGVAAEVENVRGPASLRVELLDNLYSMDKATLTSNVNLQWD
ncbi:hypothetical protein WJX75_004445 [Coccomyxa subellipsoidea]|uniref:hydroxyethylthiazole kinase n=1 Tax=Coccomyxa subellipsoidea TaxID=248742 RepID=A0ABR2YFF9_9CHLO